MIRNLFFASLALFITAQSVRADSDLASTADQPVQEVESDHSVIESALLYIPNRVLDLLDIFRLRLRVGPGLALGARVTEPLSAYIGSYGAVYAGLPGPRMSPVPRLPIGLESHNGLQLSVLDVTGDMWASPDYSPTEVGVSAHLFLIGADADVDPWEALDFIAGIFLMDLRNDDF